MRTCGLPLLGRTLTIEQVIAALTQHQQVMLDGEPGAGKTCLLRTIRHRLPLDQFRLTYCANVTLGRRDFYRHFAHRSPASACLMPIRTPSPADPSS